MVLEKEKVTDSDRAACFIVSRRIEQLKTLRPIDVAFELNVNINRLSYIFKKERKISLSNFIEKARLNESVLIINKNPDISIEELCKTVGFSKKKLNNLFERNYFVGVEKYKEFVKMRKTGD